MTNKSTRGGCEYIFPRDLLQLMLIKMPHFSVTQQSCTQHVLAVLTVTGAISCHVSPTPEKVLLTLRKRSHTLLPQLHWSMPEDLLENS